MLVRKGVAAEGDLGVSQRLAVPHHWHPSAHGTITLNFFPLRVTEPWPRLPREAVESPSLEIFQPRLDKVLCSLLWVTLLGQGVGLGDPQRALPTPTILGF